MQLQILKYIDYSDIECDSEDLDKVIASWEDDNGSYNWLDFDVEEYWEPDEDMYEPYKRVAEWVKENLEGSEDMRGVYVEVSW